VSVEGWVAVAAGVAAALLFIRRVLGGGRVSSSIVLQKIQAGARVVDVRSPEEFRSGAYPGAVNIPVQALPARLHEVPKGGPVVLYCASGIRSGAAARILKQAGYDDVVNAGGLHQMPR
jgi:phage shock protein E